MLKGSGIKILAMWLFVVFGYAASCFAQSQDTLSGVTLRPVGDDPVVADEPVVADDPVGEDPVVEVGNVSPPDENVPQEPPMEGNMPPDEYIHVDSHVSDALPDAAPYAIRVSDGEFDPMALDEPDVPGSPPRPMTRKERRLARKAEKEQAAEPVAPKPQSFKVASGRKMEDIITEQMSADSLLITKAQQDSLAGVRRDSIMRAHADILAALPPAGELFDSLSVAEVRPRVDSLLRSYGRDPASELLARTPAPDSLGAAETVSDEIYAGILRNLYTEVRDSVMVAIERERMVEGIDTLTLSRRQMRLRQKMLDRADTTLYRHNRFFRDTLGFNGFTALSLIPGFGQFYNGDYWKIPVFYGVLGTAGYFTVKQHKQYRHYKEIYDYRTGGGFPREMIDPVQNNMIIHNTARQILFGATYASYLYMLGDAMTNYPADNKRVQTATWLSTFCPGAGQIYNGSYWRVPWALGGFSAFLYVVDWNNRIYQRYSTAFNLETDGDPTTVSEFHGTAQGDPSRLQNEKNSARRNRDLCLIMTGVWYLFNIMDAHVDAQLKDFDVSDDLAWRLEPTVDYFYTPATGNVSVVGLSLSYNF